MDHAGLLNCLKAESELLAALLIALREQQAALVAARSGEVLALSQRAEDLIKQIQQASKSRHAAQAGFESLDAAAESAADLRTRTQFKACLAALRNGSAELGKLQARNSALIQQGQIWVEGTLSSFVQLQTQGQPAIYGAAGTDSQNWQSERSLCDFNA